MMCVFITAVPIIKLFAWGEELCTRSCSNKHAHRDSGGVCVCGISGLEAPVRHAAFWQVSARHMVALAREQRFPEGRIRGCYVEQKGQGW